MRNPAQIRGDIQRGLTGEKRAGFDPAAAPLETDAEAGGASATAAELQMSERAAQAGTGHAADSYQDAMLPVADARPPRRLSPYVFFLIAFIVVLGGGALLAALLR